MKPNPKISAAVAAIVGASGLTMAFAQEQAESSAATSAPSGGLQEVTVTAQRRVENVQDVPITVQAITGAQLQQLNVTNFDSLLKYTPNVTFSGNGPGTGNIFMRGLGGIGSGNQSQSTTAAFPNVALYLDDQSMQFPARNNDVYVVDMERIEVLEGPQGTLFGGGAQAGAIRYITNKPNLNATTGEFNAGYGVTTGGDPNSKVNAVLNVPLIPGTFALRAVVFSERQGGYIDNVPGTIGYLANSPQVLAGVNPIANNYQLQNTNTNPVSYQGLRVSALWQINDNWNFLIQQNYQNMEADGYFYSYPEAPDGQVLQPYQITGFVPAWNKDHYESTAWTLNGDFSGLHAVYTGSYMRREIDAQQDYSNYLRSAVGSYYGCIGPGAGYFNPKNFPQISASSKLFCGNPVGGWHDSVDNVHQQQEFRLSTNPEYRLRGLFGAFWEKFVIYDRMNFNYMAIPQCDPAILATTGPDGPYCLNAVGPVPGAYASDPSLREQSDTAFGEDEQRGYKQTAFFISGDFDLIPKTLTLSAGTRWYHYDEFENGSEFYSESAGANMVNVPNGTCTAAGGCGFPINLSKSESGFRSRANLTWHITPDIMAYYLFSQGFRPGGFNRTASLPGEPPSLAAEAPFIAGDSSTKQYLKPVGYNSDNLINNEIGFKSELFDHHLLFNVSAYYMHWNDIQLSLFDPVHLGNTTFNVNGPSYNIKGFEVQFVARITEGLTLEGSSSVNSPEQSNAPCLISAGVTAKTPANPTPAGACITQINGVPYTNPFGELGTRPAFSPPWQFNVRARYDFTAGDYRPFAWVGASHQGPMSNQPASFPDGNAPSESPPTGWPTTTLLRYEIPGYTTYDAALGVAKDQWTASFTASNFTNVYGPSNVSSGQFIKSEIPLRPRVLMFQMGYRF
jgi:outer membrane receptor protein involved in Fe transport